MKKVSEYRLHAAECRQLASKMERGEQRELLMRMAKHWENMAADRLAIIRKQPDLAIDGEHEELGLRAEGDPRA